MYYIFINFTGECCFTVKVASLEGYQNTGAQAEDSRIFGFYFQSRGLINGRSHYRSDGGIFGIWYHRTYGWIIGEHSKRGTDNAHAYVPENTACPNDPGFTWQYYNNAANGFYNARYSLSVWCKTTVLTNDALYILRKKK